MQHFLELEGKFSKNTRIIFLSYKTFCLCCNERNI